MAAMQNELERLLQARENFFGQLLDMEDNRVFAVFGNTKVSVSVSNCMETPDGYAYRATLMVNGRPTATLSHAGWGGDCNVTPHPDCAQVCQQLSQAIEKASAPYGISISLDEFCDELTCLNIGE